MNRVEFLTSRTPPNAAWTLVAAGWIAAIGMAFVTIQLHRRAADSHRAVQESAAELRLPARRVFDAPVYETDARAALKLNSNALDDALRQVEGVSVIGTQVRSVDIDLENGRAQIMLDFKDVASLKAYLEAINAGRDLDRWLLKKLDQRRDVTGASPSLGAILERPL
jgi:hypothetical protein